MRETQALLRTPQLTGRTIPMRPPVSYEQFKEWAWSASHAVEQQTSTKRTAVAIPKLRQALSHVPFTSFNQHLLRMERNGLVYLIPPEDPDRLSEDERRLSLSHPSGDLRTLLLWMSYKPQTLSFWD